MPESAYGTIRSSQVVRAPGPAEIKHKGRCRLFANFGRRGKKIVPVSGTKVLFSIWNTRSEDFRVFVESAD